MPKVSVIIPNYNHASFLKQRIESVLNQTFQDFEIILLDDCSTDISKEIITLYSNHPKISHILLNEKNSGSTFRQWNKGIAMASGDYIWIAESDDLAEPLLLEILVQKLEDHPNVGIAYSNSRMMNELDHLLETWDYWMQDIDPQRWKQDFINQGQDEVRNYAVIRNTIPNASGVVFRKSLYKKVGGAHEYFRFVGDWDLWVRMLEHMDVAYIATCLNYFRRHSNTTRSNYQIPGSGYLTEVYGLLNNVYSRTHYRPSLLKNTLAELFHIWHQGSIKFFWINATRKNIRLASKIDDAFYYKTLTFLKSYLKRKLLSR